MCRSWLARTSSASARNPASPHPFALAGGGYDDGALAGHLPYACAECFGGGSGIGVRGAHGVKARRRWAGVGTHAFGEYPRRHGVRPSPAYQAQFDPGGGRGVGDGGGDIDLAWKASVNSNGTTTARVVCLSTSARARPVKSGCVDSRWAASASTPSAWLHGSGNLAGANDGSGGATVGQRDQRWA